MQVELLAYTQSNPALTPETTVGRSDLATIPDGHGPFPEQLIEYAGRVCYRSTHRMGTAPEFIAARVRELTDGEGVAAVYDSVGKDTFTASLDALRFHGTMVSFGNASGPVDPVSPLELAQRGSLYLTRPGAVSFHSDASGTARRLRRTVCGAGCGHAGAHRPDLCAR